MIVYVAGVVAGGVVAGVVVGVVGFVVVIAVDDEEFHHKTAIVAVVNYLFFYIVGCPMTP